MTYNEFINNILQTRGRFACGDKYCERHHILPRCVGGNNDEDNLIDLFAKEHFIAHKLLAEENPNNQKIVCAYAMMAFPKSEKHDNNRYVLTPTEYECARIAISRIMTNRLVSDETRKKLSESHKGILPTEESKKKMSESQKVRWDDESRQEWSNKYSGENNPMYGKHHSEETKQLLREKFSGENSCWYGKHHTEETRKKISESNKGEKNSMYGKHLTEESKKKISKTLSKPVLCIETGIIYVSIKEAERQTGIDGTNISRCCRNIRNHATAGGYHWVYYEYEI